MKFHFQRLPIITNNKVFKETAEAPLLFEAEEIPKINPATALLRESKKTAEAAADQTDMFSADLLDNTANLTAEELTLELQHIEALIKLKRDKERAETDAEYLAVRNNPLFKEAESKTALSLMALKQKLQTQLAATEVIQQTA